MFKSEELICNWKICLCFLFNLLWFAAFRNVVVAWKPLDHTYIHTLYVFIVDKTYPRRKITQAYISLHLIDYLVLLFLHIVCIWIGFQFCSFFLTVRLFVFIEHIYKTWWLSFLFVHENQSSKDYFLCNCPIRCRRKRENELIKYTYVNICDSLSSLYLKWMSSSLKEKKKKFSSVTKSNCLYDYVLEYWADLTFSINSAGDWLVVTYNRHVIH